MQGHFPEAKLDPVIQIASMVTVQGSDHPIVKNVMTLGSCASIVGAEVMSFERYTLMVYVSVMLKVGSLINLIVEILRPSQPCV